MMDVHPTEFENFTLRVMKELMSWKDCSWMQKESFDFFIYHKLHRIIDEEPLIEIPLVDGRTYRVNFGQVFVDRPYIVDENRVIRYITPNEARLRDITYSSIISVNIRTSIVENIHQSDEIEHTVQEFRKIHLARIPIMVQSSKCNLFGKNAEELGECAHDNGGYFIIKGKERVLVSQERMNHNTVYVFEQKPNSRYVLIGEIRSMSEETGHSILVQMKICNTVEQKIVLQIPFINGDIPLGIVFKAYGFNSQEITRILKFNLGNLDHPMKRKVYKTIIRDAEMMDTQEKAEHYICQFSMHPFSKDRRSPYISQILNNELFPHLGLMSDKNQKGFFLGHMLQRLVATHIGARKEDDRDHLANKRIETSGYLLCELFRTLYKRFIRTLEPQLVKRPDIIVVMSRVNIITQGIRHCFSTGNWGIPKSSYIRTGVSQVLSRLTYNSMLSHLKRILIPIGKEGKNTKIRQVNVSQIGFICPHETPEGGSSGIVKNMAFLTEISLKMDTTFVRSVIEEDPNIFMNFDPMHEFYDFTERDDIQIDYYKIFLNGIWIGISKNKNIYDILFKYKEDGRFHQMISISFNGNEKEICVFGDEGRPIRPLYNLKKLPPYRELQSMHVETMIENGVIQYVDPHEMDNYIVAMSISEVKQHPTRYNFLEIHPSSISSICTGLIPYSDHTQAPRITYHASMGKQAIGLYATTHLIRADAVSHLLLFPERPLIKTHASEISNCDSMVNGSNLIVAICMYTGFNQEDSVILNQSAIDRGLLRSFMYKTIVVEERKKSTNSTEVIELSPLELRNKSYNYSKLDNNGIIRTGYVVGSGDVIVSRVHYRQIKSGGDEKIDTSVIIKSGEEGVIDRVFVCSSPDGYRIVKVRIRNQKIPEIGDKVASRNAQKGTVGMVLRAEDMPFSSSGIIPDLIINPLCIPSRMTINQLIESIAAKGAIHRGKFRYATPFTSHSTDIVDSLTADLHKCGFQRHGLERMMNGMTGEMLDMDIFIGPVYYQRLKHLVSAKIHARNHGSIQALTRQPLEGRSRDGGLRFGEMERDTCSGESQISLKCGLSIKLATMATGIWDVLGWDPSRKGVRTSKKVAFIDKGAKHCVEITLQDGRTIVCTPDHPMLTSDLEWVRANELSINKSRLKVGLHYPCIDIESEIKECKGWSFDHPGVNVYADTIPNYLRGMAFMRVLGRMITDTRVHNDHMIFYHRSDVQSFLDDLGYFCARKSVYDNGDHYIIMLPSDFVNIIEDIEGIGTISFPCFVFAEDFPRPLLREFLGGMFGGDGQTCSLEKRDVLTSVSLSKSSTNVDSLVKIMENVKTLLSRCGIENITIDNSIHEKTTTHYRSTLHLDISELLPFWENIGFRYCAHKSLCLEAGASYARLQEVVTKQHHWLLHRVDEIMNRSKTRTIDHDMIVDTDRVIRQAVDELSNNESLHRYAIPKVHGVTVDTASFPNAGEFLKHVGAYHWFTDTSIRRDDVLPTMEMTVIGVRPYGLEKVYDIEVEDINSFLANGIVAHNCMISHGVSRFLTERLYDMSDKFTIHVCRKCGSVPDDLNTCHICEDLDLTRVKIPYACKLLFQELNAMGIKIRMFPESFELNPRVVEKNG